MLELNILELLSEELRRQSPDSLQAYVREKRGSIRIHPASLHHAISSLQMAGLVPALADYEHACFSYMGIEWRFHLEPQMPRTGILISHKSD